MTNLLDPEERAAAVRLLSSARNARAPGSSKSVAAAVSTDPLGSWRLAAVAAWLVRLIAGRFGNSLRDRTDDPVMADNVLREARRALDGDAPYDKELVHLAALATSDGPGDARAAAHRWYERQPHNFDTWMVADSAIDLLRHLSDLRATQVAGGIAGDDLTRDAVLDAVSAELIEVEMATGTTDFKDET